MIGHLVLARRYVGGVAGIPTFAGMCRQSISVQSGTRVEAVVHADGWDVSVYDWRGWTMLLSGPGDPGTLACMASEVPHA